MTNQEWVDGLPPVGCECECQLVGANGWVVVTISGRGRSIMLAINSDGDEVAYALSAFNFRPIKTQEKEREEAIKEIAALLSGFWQDEDQPMANVLYDAGYRKVNELSDEEIEVFLKGRASLLSPPYKIEAAKWAIDYILDKEK